MKRGRSHGACGSIGALTRTAHTRKKAEEEGWCGRRSPDAFHPRPTCPHLHHRPRLHKLPHPHRPSCFRSPRLLRPLRRLNCRQPPPFCTQCPCVCPPNPPPSSKARRRTLRARPAMLPRRDHRLQTGHARAMVPPPRMASPRPLGSIAASHLAAPGMPRVLWSLGTTRTTTRCTPQQSSRRRSSRRRT